MAKPSRQKGTPKPSTGAAPSQKRAGKRTPELENQILAWIASGKTLRAFCRRKDTPCFQAVYNWLDADDQFAGRFARARSVGFDALSQEALAIADADPGFTKHGRDAGGVAWAKNRVWTRLQLLARWDPGRYGDRQRIDVESKGGLIKLLTGVPEPEAPG